MKPEPLHRRPGEVVCICEKNGNISLFEPGAWRRTMLLHYRKADERKEEENDHEDD